MRQCPFEKELILVSNRGPFSYRRDARGELITQRGAGGLVTALLGVATACEITWIASAMTPEDSEMSLRMGGGRINVRHEDHQLGLRFVVTDPEVYNRFYNVIANPMIWFIQHYLWNLSVAPEIRINEFEAWEGGYQVVNGEFAAAVIDELRQHVDEKPVVMFHDYHLYTCPELVRKEHPDVFLHQFVHIPWPQSDSWRVLPRHIRRAVIKGLLANDIVAFHTRRYVRNFLVCCEEILDLEIDYRNSAVSYEGRDVWVRAYPISVDCADFERLAESAPVRREEGRIMDLRREYLILRVDRMDLSKNIVRGFKAFDMFLDEHPEFRERITFLALLQPSREDIEEYVEYRQKIMRVVEIINTRHGTTNWMPIDVRMQDNFARSVAAYKQFDVLMVNAIYDGMNLIAKEAGLINRQNGVIILSENAGAHEELGDFCITVNPFDLESQSRAIHQALSMPEDDKNRMAGKIRDTVRNNDIHKWIETQFVDIKAKMSEGISPGHEEGSNE
ncbi:MAG: trehalose-6-phosphate synthase [Thermoleophilia bacterium]|nr:trehalose-6-phosphate synthase [Thermoleophilia bacterium]